jgi:4-hydroxy-tetrahydrodipicolinate reductase
MTRIIIAGANGKMGQALSRLAETYPNLVVAARIDVGHELGEVIHKADVVLDFSAHDVTVSFVRLCAEHNKAIVVGTTGHTEAEREELLKFSRQIPMVWTANFSTGVNALYYLTRKAAEILGPSYDLEIVEMHHRFKKDAPSGTARTLAQILADARRLQIEKVAQHGRQGITGERTTAEIGIHSMRGGDVVGDHTVIFAAAGERVELTPKASNRDTFASGALRAAQWIVGKPPGLYDMQDVLGLK